MFNCLVQANSFAKSSAYWVLSRLILSTQPSRIASQSHDAAQMHTVAAPHRLSPALRASAKRFPPYSLAAWRLGARSVVPPSTAAPPAAGSETDSWAPVGVGGITQLHIFHDTENCTVPWRTWSSEAWFGSAIVAAVVRRSLGLAVGDATVMNMSDHDIAARVAVHYEWVESDPSHYPGRRDVSQQHAQLQAAGARVVNAGTAKGCVDLHIRAAMLQLRVRLESAPPHVRRSSFVTVITGDYDFAPEVKELTAPFAASKSKHVGGSSSGAKRAGGSSDDAAGVRVAILSQLRGGTASGALLQLASRTLGRSMVGSWERVRSDIAAIISRGSTPDGGRSVRALPHQWAVHGTPPVYSYSHTAAAPSATDASLLNTSALLGSAQAAAATSTPADASNPLPAITLPQLQLEALR